jgi:hypothetical protein
MTPPHRSNRIKIMDESTEDTGIILALLERFETQTLPRALALKRKVDQGGVLDEFDIRFLETVFRENTSIRTLISRHPEYEPLAAKVIHLYHDITAKALENEKTSRGLA